MDPSDRREPKRARQACLNCRRKKARCSGEKPVCAFCARLKQPCEWDSTSHEPANASKSTPATRRASGFTQDSALAARVALLEAKLSLLNDGSTLSASSGRATTTSSSSSQVQRPRKRRGMQTDHDTLDEEIAARNFSSLPGKDIFSALIDAYFEYNHCQPYSYFHETTFRQSFEDDALPEYLLFAFAATACRFCEHEFFIGRQLEAMSVYANASWHQIYEESFSSEGGSLEISMVQATSMLAAIDFTSGHYKLGWVKFSLTIRFALGLRLNEEPDEELPLAEQEERRRTFWSVYLLDALISLGPNRPRSILDADCSLRLPCHEDLFRNGLASDFEPTLEAVIENPYAAANQNLDYMAMTVLMASALGRFIRLAMKRSPKTVQVPWDPRSQYFDVHSMLLHFEAFSPCVLNSITETLQYQFTFDNAVDRPRCGHFLYSNALFHVTHCLLNHPFVLYHLLQATTASIPPSFVEEALQRCHKHATEMLDLLHDAQQYGHLVQSSFYGYCAMLSGVIHRLYEGHEDPAISAASRERYWSALNFLDAKPVRWPIFSNMALSLRSFRPDMDTCKALTSAVALSQRHLIKDGAVLWQLLDYARIPELTPISPAVRSSDERASSSSQPELPQQPGPSWTTAARASIEHDTSEPSSDIFGGLPVATGIWSPFLGVEDANDML